jgi:hypothetical protein
MQQNENQNDLNKPVSFLKEFLFVAKVSDNRP